MKSFAIIFLVFLLAGCHSAASNSASKPQLNANLDPKGTRTFVWAETGMVFTLIEGWHRNFESDDNSERAWISTDNSRFSVRVAQYKAEYGNGSIEDETNKFYQDHKKGGEEDLRYLEIDGIKGVHYLRAEKGFDKNYASQDVKVIIWNAQRMYHGGRQIINVRVSSPTQGFTKDRDTLYGLLQSIKFTQSDGGSPTSAEQVIGKPSAVLSLPTDAEIYLGKQRIARAEVAPEVDKLLRDQAEDKQIAYIKCASDVKYGTVVGIMDDIGFLGYEKIGLVADKKKAQPAPKIHSTSETMPGKKVATRSDTQATGGNQDLLVVTIETTKAGTIIIKIGETPVPLIQLASKVRGVLNGRADKAVTILAPGTIDMKSIVAVVDELKAGGAEAIGFGIKSP
jgi:biopolymer transport protein ExbD